MTDEEYYKYCLSCGDSPEEAKQHVKNNHIMQELYFNKPKSEPREITSLAYKRAMRIQKRDVENFLGIKKEK